MEFKVAAPATLNVEFNEASPATNNLLFNEASPATNNLLLNEASPDNSIPALAVSFWAMCIVPLSEISVPITILSQ